MEGLDLGRIALALALLGAAPALAESPGSSAPGGKAATVPGGKAPLGSPAAPSAGPGILEPAATPAAPSDVKGAKDPADADGVDEPPSRGPAAPDRGRAGDEASDLKPSAP